MESEGVAMPISSVGTEPVLKEDLQIALDEDNVPEVGDPEEEDEEEDEDEEDDDEEETDEDSGWSD